MKLTKLTMLVLTGLGAFAGVAAANADPLLSRNHYDDELNRCIAQIRSDIAADPEMQLEHRVTEISKDGAWYRFTIETRDAAIAVTASCQASRFSDETRLTVDQSPASAQRLASY